MKSIQRIICPVINAFNLYSKIVNTVKKKVSKNKLILIALGPTATLLSFDLYKLGYQSIDVGHVDIEYEWFLRNAKRKIPIILLLKTNMLMKKEMDINGSLLLVIKIIIGK